MVISLCGQKGGVGKTTVAVALIGELLERGRRVLSVDADPQGSLRTWGAVATEGGHPTPTMVSMDATMHHPGQLDALAAGYDVTIIDCPPRLGDVQRSALMISDLAILPCGPSAMDAWAITESVETVRSAQVLRPKLRAVVLITRVLSRTALGRGARDVLAGTGLEVLRAELGSRVAYMEAPAAGLGIAQYDHEAAGAEVRALVDELVGMPIERVEVLQ